jgi:hypothetical protein
MHFSWLNLNLNTTSQVLVAIPITLAHIEALSASLQVIAHMPLLFFFASVGLPRPSFHR